MKLTEKANGLYLENISAKDIRYANLAGRMTNSPYDDPNKPKHVYVLWVEDDDILERLRENHVRISEKEDRDDPKIMRHSVTFKCYPKKRVNRFTGKEEQTPKIMMRTTSNTVRLDEGAFGLIDAAHIDTVDIKFRFWKYDQRKPDCVAVIEELWATVDEGAGEVDESYLDEKYGYSEEPEVPFN